ncbi:hypothetical protein HCN51_45715 [Nonomuraea sp. FMUSA5-5]|uniref:Uncharacterized protein n=1 Tax=Nonomuraea composti TaxID=2720023 RepID=A0ABX1BN20_9ACTN|nr:hypothetical protein [Nonomuraea sp. FMUSA5-5]NJP96651.1 hypothetical protein [Nonomuraea sp. FMUSA5-5]
MADISGMRFAGSPDIDRSRLPDAHVRPRQERGSRYLYWPTPEGDSSGSPAHRRAFADIGHMDTNGLVRWVWEGVELPGTASDYHFLLQGAIKQLWSRRRPAPEGLQSVEVFAALDLGLIEAVPHAVAIDEADLTRGFARLASVEVWMKLLETEGALRDAVAVSRRAQRFGESYRRADLEAKVAALDAEGQ